MERWRPAQFVRRGRPGDGMMRGVTGAGSRRLGQRAVDVTVAEERRLYLRTELPTSRALSMGGARLSEALVRYPQVATGVGDVGPHGR